MDTSNPVLGRNTFSQFANTARGEASARMSIQGTLNKSLLLIALAIFSGGFSWAFLVSNPAVGLPLIVVAAIVAFVLAIVTAFRPQNSPFLAPIYALCEGAVLGGVSAFFASAYAGIVPVAIGLTLAVPLVMLGLYRAGVLRATPAFTRMVIMATGGIALVYGVAFLMRLFGLSMPFLWTPTPIGIGIELVIVGIAALNFVLDFDFIERGALQGAPKFMEWYGAFSLCVTLFWLYMEILRLLSMLNDRR